jgi:hypothetical protein
VDDILVIHHNPSDILNRLDKAFPLKAESVGDPDMYLGAKLRTTVLGNGMEAWAFSPAKYVREAVSNCEKFIRDELKGGFTFPKRADNPFPTDYRPEIDVSEPLEPDAASYYQSVVQIMRWMVELGRVDIITEISMLASHLALPRVGHMEAALHVMAYLKQKYNSRLVLDPTYPFINEDTFQHCDWQEFYHGAEEPIPGNMPKPRGKGIDLRLFVDSDHAGDKRNRRSRTGFLIYLNTALIQWYSKAQSTCETSVFGAEFLAMKTGVDTLRGVRYKLRMMGVPVMGPTFIFGDNMSVINNTSRPESVLRKKCNEVCYHSVRESVAMGESLTAHIRSEDNPADLMTKLLFGQKRRSCVDQILYDIYDSQ